MRQITLSMLIVILFSLGLNAGCSRAPIVTRTKVEKTVDLSGRWNDTDSRMVSEEMIKDCLERPWYAEFHGKFNRVPVVIVGTITNKSHEHIDSQVFINDLEQNLLNSGKVTFVASQMERDEVRDEREDQQVGDTNPKTIKPKGRETGADYMLQGSIHSIKDEIKGKYAILYQVNLELINLTNNQKVWIGQEEIKKIVSRAEYSF